MIKGIFFVIIIFLKKVKKYNIPTILFNKIVEIFPITNLSSKNERERAFKLLHIIITLSQKQNGNPDQYAEISSTYFKKAFSSNYINVLKKLRDNKVIEGLQSKTSKDSYTVKLCRNNNNIITGKVNIKPTCKKIRICSKYNFTNSITLLNSINNNSNQNNNNNEIINCFQILNKSEFSEVEYSYKPKTKTKENRVFEKEFSSMVDSLIIDYDKLYSKAIDIVENIDIEDYVVENAEVEDGIKKVKHLTTGKTYSWDLVKAKESANFNYERLYKVETSYFIGSKYQFEKHLKDYRMFSYVKSIQNLENRDFRAERNSTNNRLDTNFTNMKSELFKIIMEDNNLVQIDMNNSQFTFLANYLKNEKGFDTEDFNHFYKMTTEGVLYDNISKELGIKRKEAKLLLFQILFNKAGIKIKHKDLLEQRFPTVMNYINTFKKNQGYKSFSIFLQKLESKMFIDNLYPKIKEVTDIVITKHDSISVRKEDKLKVENIILNHFKSNNFKCSLSWE